MSARDLRDNRLVSSDLSLENQTCDAHADRPAVDRCASCGRTVCLRCAVPVRGRVLCTTCAAREVGEPPPAVRERRRRSVPASVAVVLLGLALVATIPPWDRFGTALSPWRPSVSPWRVLATVAVLLAFAAAAVALRRGPRTPRRGTTAAYTVLAASGATAIAWQIVASPDYVAHTWAPYVMIALAAAAALVGALRLRRPE